MQVLVVLGHPSPASLNHAIAEHVVSTLQDNGHSVIFHDLYADKFDAILPDREIPKGAALDPVLQRYCDELANADGIVIVHPNWWGQPPAILKGWIDRVVRPGVAYEFVDGDGGEGVPVGLLKAQKALVFNTANTSTSRELAVFGDPLETLWKNCIFGLCGVKQFFRKTYTIVCTSTLEQRGTWLADVRRITSEYFPVYLQERVLG